MAESDAHGVRVALDGARARLVDRHTRVAVRASRGFRADNTIYSVIVEALLVLWRMQARPCVH